MDVAPDHHHRDEQQSHAGGPAKPADGHGPVVEKKMTSNVRTQHVGSRGMPTRQSRNCTTTVVGSLATSNAACSNLGAPKRPVELESIWLVRDANEISVHPAVAVDIVVDGHAQSTRLDVERHAHGLARRSVDVHFLGHERAAKPIRLVVYSDPETARSIGHIGYLDSDGCRGRRHALVEMQTSTTPDRKRRSPRRLGGATPAEAGVRLRTRSSPLSLKS